jgi:carbonic anhydrase/acetyltransferase-like protein (isoleucine patch superfamily)
MNVHSKASQDGKPTTFFRLGDAEPLIDPTAWIAPTAAIIGDVRIGAESGIWFHCVLRGDANFIEIGKRSNIQDGTIVHVDPGEFSTVIGDDVTVGHGCIIHGCRLEDKAFVGMGATVMNGAVIEGGGVLGAGGLLLESRRIKAGELWTGAPAKLRRVLTDEERAAFISTAAHYVRNAGRFGSALTPAWI